MSGKRNLLPPKILLQGDSGGGLLARDKISNRYDIVGVHSYAYDCDDKHSDDSMIYSSTFVGFHVDEICKLTGVCKP